MSTDEEKKSPGSGCAGHKDGAMSTEEKKQADESSKEGAMNADDKDKASDEADGKKPGGSG